VYHDLGKQSGRVYTLLREGILRGTYPPGSPLPAYTKLAAQFGVSAVTVRQVLGRLEEEGLVDRQQGRGTFVQARTAPSVLIVDDEEDMRELLRTFAMRAGHQSVEVSTPGEALEALGGTVPFALVLSDVRLPERADGISFIRAVRHRWPELPLVAITGYPDDLAELHGTPECPVLTLAKPVWEHQVQEIFRMVLRPVTPASPGAHSRAGRGGA
jgi:CheY-like chemotaxis protein